MSLDEGAVIGRYLLGHEINERTQALYSRAAHELGYDRDDAITLFARSRPWALAALDGALALSNTDASLRKKLLLMAAVLEAQPEYAGYFLTHDRAPFEFFAVAWRVVRGWSLAVAGLCLLRLVR
jgi:hypothetical protein